MNSKTQSTGQRSPKLLQRILKKINLLGNSSMEPDVEEIPGSSASRTRDVVDKKNKGKAIQVDSFSYNNVQSHHHPPLNLESFQDYYDHDNSLNILANQAIDSNDYSPLQSLLEPDLATVPAPPSKPLSYDASASSSSPIAAAAVSPFQDYYDHDNPLNILANQAIDSGDYSMLQDLLEPDLATVPAPPSKPLSYDASASSSSPIAAAVSPSVRRIKEEFLRDFKRFDTVDDFSDHHFASRGTATKQHSKTWVKKVQADWKILENDLPESIFVRACESRMDLLRAVIIGAEGTPYHDGLFFFDIQFPDAYPSVPPMVNYHSGGLRINPNLYSGGKVCLSLLGTWSGNSREKWLPKESTVLQLLVSIQALILNQKPYFNEPGYERSKGTSSGESLSKAYSENVFLLSLKTMVYSMRNPPKHFEEFVKSHFFVRSHDIVKACNAYKDGVPVGSRIKGGVIEETSQRGSNKFMTNVATFMKTVGSTITGGVIEETSQSGSYQFRTDVAIYMKPVVDEFVKVGVKELEEKPKLT